MIDEASLLREYADSRNESAFAQVVERHFDAVFSSAVRRVGGDAHLARDVAQEVFSALAREASRVASHPVISAWLHTTTRNIAALKVRQERRRRNREREASAMNTHEGDGRSEVDWSRIAPVLDRAIDSLGMTDRHAILLRFIDRRSYAEVGASLELSENAARMRVDRALEKLRAVLRRQGIPSTAAALAAALADQAVVAAPAGAAAEATTAVLAGTLAGGGTGYTAATFTLMNSTKITAGVILVLAAASGVWVSEHHSRLTINSLTRDNRRLEQLLNGAVSREMVLKARSTQSSSPTKLEDLGWRVREEMLSAGDGQRPPASSYRNAGQATPLAALETFMWASDRADTSTLARTIAFGGNGRQRALAVLAALPQDAQAQFSSPEELYALLIADDALSSPPPPEEIVQSVKVQFDGTDQAILIFPGPNHQQVYQNTPEGWKFVIPEGAVEQFANSILSSGQVP